MRSIKNFIKSHPNIMRFLFACVSRVPFNNKIKGRRKNKVVIKGLMQGCRLTFRGVNNTFEVRDGAKLKNCVIQINGNNNHIVFGKQTYAKNADVYTEDDNNRILVGDGTDMCGKIHLAAIEGTIIDIGKNCLFSSEIVFRTGDGHSILNMNGNRINPSQDIKINDHVWIGHRVCVNKGVVIGSDNIIGTAAVVTKSIIDTNTVIAGVPAKVVKTDVNWDGERIRPQK